MSGSYAASRIAADLADTRRRLAALERAQRLANTSLHRSSVPVYDADGTLRMVLGQQGDGSYTTTDRNGAPPPIPAAPSVDTQPGLLVITSYGLTASGADWPLDLRRLDVHVGVPGFTPDVSTKVAEFTTDGGSAAIALDPGPWAALLVAVNTSGVESQPSIEVTATVPPPGALPPDPPVAPDVTLTGMPRGIMAQVTNGKPGWTYTFTITDHNNDATPDVTASYPATTRPLLYVEAMPDGTPLTPASSGYSFTVTATNETGTATSPETHIQPLVLNDSNTIAEIAVGKLTTGNFVGAFALLGSLGVGSAITIDDDNGIVITQPDGGVIAFPADGTAASISAHLDAFSLTVRDKLFIRGTINEISAGSVLALASGVAPPPAAPRVDAYWPQTTFAFAPSFENTVHGLTRTDATSSWWAVSVFFGTSIRLCDNNGAGIASWDLPSNYTGSGGIVAIGTKLYVLAQDSNRPDATHSQPYRWFVRRYETSSGAPVFLGEWECTDAPNGTMNPAIGRTAAGNVLIAKCGAGGKPSIYEHVPDTGAAVGSPVTLNEVVNANLTSVYYGAADLPGANYIFTSRSAVYAVDVLGRRYASMEWQRAGSQNIEGLCWDPIDGRWYQLDDKGRRWTFGKVTQDTARSVAYSWFDSDPAGTGQHETPLGPARSYTQKPRTFMLVSTSTPPDNGGADDPDSVRIWIGGQLQPDLGPGATSATYDTPATGNTTKAAGFPTAASTGQLRSTGAAADGSFLIDLRGDGSGRTGPFGWDAFGKLTRGFDAGISPQAAAIPAGSSGDVTVPFANAFSAPPIVTATSRYQWAPASILSVTATQVVIRFRNNHASADQAPDAMWMAFGS